MGMQKDMAMRCRNQTNWQQTKSEQHGRDNDEHAKASGDNQQRCKWKHMMSKQPTEMQMETHDEQTMTPHQLQNPSQLATN
jgi:hypothetical protein